MSFQVELEWYRILKRGISYHFHPFLFSMWSDKTNESIILTRFSNGEKLPIFSNQFIRSSFRKICLYFETKFSIWEQVVTMRTLASGIIFNNFFHEYELIKNTLVMERNFKHNFYSFLDTSIVFLIFSRLQ